MSASDPDFDLIAALDQKAAEGEAIARMLAPFHLGLEAAGVPEGAAATVTSTYLECLLGSAGESE